MTHKKHTEEKTAQKEVKTTIVNSAEEDIRVNSYDFFEVLAYS